MADSSEKYLYKVVHFISTVISRNYLIKSWEETVSEKRVKVYKRKTKDRWQDSRSRRGYKMLSHIHGLLAFHISKTLATQHTGHSWPNESAKFCYKIGFIPALGVSDSLWSEKVNALYLNPIPKHKTQRMVFLYLF